MSVMRRMWKIKILATHSPTTRSASAPLDRAHTSTYTGPEGPVWAHWANKIVSAILHIYPYSLLAILVVVDGVAKVFWLFHWTTRKPQDVPIFSGPTTKYPQFINGSQDRRMPTHRTCWRRDGRLINRILKASQGWDGWDNRKKIEESYWAHRICGWWSRCNCSAGQHVLVWRAFQPCTIWWQRDRKVQSIGHSVRCLLESTVVALPRRHCTVWGGSGVVSVHGTTHKLSPTRRRNNFGIQKSGQNRKELTTTTTGEISGKWGTMSVDAVERPTDRGMNDGNGRNRFQTWRKTATRTWWWRKPTQSHRSDENFQLENPQNHHPEFVFFCRNNNNNNNKKKKSSAKSFAYCNRFLPLSLSLSLSLPLSGRLTFKNAKFKTAKRARNFKFTHQSISPWRAAVKGNTQHDTIRLPKKKMNKKKFGSKKKIISWRHYMDAGRLVICNVEDRVE